MLPFTREQFIAAFADDNAAVWPAQVMPIDRLREMARRLLRQSPNYPRLLRDLGAAQSPQ